MRAGQRHSRDGLSLVEVLVAITILLVGVYAVASGFPRLLQTIDNNKVRTERTRDARAILDGWVDRASGLPFAITYDPDPDYDPTTPAEPVDPTTPPDLDQLNARDDLYRVVGETFTLPRYIGATPAGGGPRDRACVHVLAVGPAHYEPLPAPPPPPPPPDPRLRPDVYELVPLRRADVSAGYRLRADEFDVVGFDRGPDGIPGTADDRTGLITLSNFVRRRATANADPGPDETPGTGDEPGFSLDELLADYTWIDIDPGPDGNPGTADDGPGNVHFASDVRLRIDLSGLGPMAQLVAINPATIDPARSYYLQQEVFQILPETVRLFWKNRFFLAGEVDPVDPAWSSSDPTILPLNHYQVDNVLVAAGTGMCFTLAFGPREAARDVFGQPTRERVLRVDYYLAREIPQADDREERPTTQPRQLVIMTEDHQVSLEPNGTDDMGNQIHRVKLRTKFLDTAGPMPFAQAPAQRADIIAVDLHDGLTYSDNVALLPTQAVSTTGDLARIGEVFFYPSAPVIDPTGEHRGHKLRFYYRGEEQPTQRLQKPPATFIEGPIDAYGADPSGIIMANIPPDGVPDFPDEALGPDPGPDGILGTADDIIQYGYRQYRPDPNWNPASGDPLDLSKIGFPRSCIGQAVEIDYLWEDPDAPTPGLKRTNGELHLIAGDMGASQNAVPIRLRHNPGTDPAAIPDGTPGNSFTVRAIIAVRGVSVKSIAWWRTSDGKLRRVEVSTYLTKPMG